jgi:hypothetical protein
VTPARGRQTLGLEDAITNCDPDCLGQSNFEPPANCAAEGNDALLLQPQKRWRGRLHSRSSGPRAGESGHSP